MMPMRLLLAPLLLILTACTTEPEATVPEDPIQRSPDPPEALVEAFRSALDEKAQEAFESGNLVVPGRDGWLFFAPELRSLAVGRFWGEAAAEVSRAPREDAKDPLPAILDFERQLEERGVRLLFVPVPAKAALYPGKIVDAVHETRGEGPPPRLDLAHGEFLQALREEGVESIDLVEVYREHWGEGEDRLYCRQDTHWSGRGLELAAREIARRVGEPDWLEETRSRYPLAEAEPETREVQITGDLWRDLEPADGSKPPKETVPLTFLRSIETRRDSPVLLLGDSHVLVFHAGDDLHARGAGLPEHLSQALGTPVDLIGVRGSGATPARVNLLRRGDGLAGKKVVVWVLAVREYTEGQGWQKVPVER